MSPISAWNGRSTRKSGGRAPPGDRHQGRGFRGPATMRRDGPPVVWLRVGNTTRDLLLRIVNAALPDIVAALESGETVVEVIEEAGLRYFERRLTVLPIWIKFLVPRSRFGWRCSAGRGGGGECGPRSLACHPREAPGGAAPYVTGRARPEAAGPGNRALPWARTNRLSQSRYGRLANALAPPGASSCPRASGERASLSKGRKAKEEKRDGDAWRRISRPGCGALAD